MTRIPLVDLQWQHQEVAAEVQAGWARILEATAFVGGAEVAAFEQEYATFIGARHCIGVANGTDAIELALRAAGIGAGDEVILPANTFIATAMAVLRAGAIPVLVDSDPVFHLMDSGHIEARITSRTRAIIPVHLYGQAAPMQAIVAVAQRHNLVVVEDAAQVQGARQGGRMAGTLGTIAATSFYPGKNLGAYGDAGAVLTDRDDLAQRVRALRNYGSEVKYHHPMVGFNSRLDPLQAVVLRAKLRRLAVWNQARRDAARRYDDLLSSHLPCPAIMPGNEHIYHLYVVRVSERDRVMARLAESGIDAGIHYPVPLHLQGALSFVGQGPGTFPVAEAAAASILSLPMYPGITPEQQHRVADALLAALR